MTITDRQSLMDDPREGARLAAKVDSAGWVRKHLAVGLAAGSRVLEIGCGPGHIALEFASQNPGVQVIGLDISVARLKDLVVAEDGSEVLTCAGDATRLPFTDRVFDLAYCRLVLEYLRSPDTAVAEMYRVLRPGGRVVLYDLDGQMLWHDPPDDELTSAITKIVSALRKEGFDPHVGRRLYNLAHVAGFVDIVTRLEPYHVIPGRIAADQRANWQLKFDILRPAFTRLLQGSVEADRFIRKSLAYLDREDTMTYSVAFAVSASKPASGRRLL